jgi:dihydroxy-acid dehydratase
LIALVHDNDVIELDAVNNTITLKIGDEEIIKRRTHWKKPALKATKGVLFKYAKCVKPADEGCVTDEA